MAETDPIFHYTSIANLFNIVDGQSIFASDMRYCNDATETTFGRTEVRNYLLDEAARRRNVNQSTPAGTGPDQLENAMMEDDPEFWATHLESLAELISTPRQEDFGLFGVCFSRLGDSLSQWRSYGQQGCAVEVDRGLLIRESDEFNQLQTRFIDMVYGNSGLHQVYAYIRSIGGNVTSGTASTEPSFFGWELTNIQEQTAKLKHEGFAEEEETRLLISFPYKSMADTLSQTRYRVAQDGLIVPYVPVPINLAAIKSIRVGPGPHQQQNFEALQKYRRNTGYQRSIPWQPMILKSETPYR